MIIAHIADLHFGKNVNGFSLIEDQKHIVNEIIKKLEEESVEALIVAGDVYDKSVPSIEAINLFDFFINRLIELGITTFIISGNHDNSDRLSFASDVLRKHKIHVVTKYNGSLNYADLKNVRFYMLPFIKPIDVKHYFDEEIDSYDKALRLVVDSEELDDTRVNILIAHQFVTASGSAITSDSEVFQVGTLDNIDFSAFKKFDYTALGHLHRPQSVGDDNIRYSGSILKYSFSECNDTKSMVVLDTNDMKKKYVKLKPIRDMITLSGSFEDILKAESTDDYYRIILNDKYKGIDVYAKLRRIYPNLMKLEYKMDSSNEVDLDLEVRKEKDPIEIIKKFYLAQKGHEIEEKSLDVLKKELGGIDACDL